MLTEVIGLNSIYYAFITKSVNTLRKRSFEYINKAIIVFRCHCLYREKPGDMGNWPVQTDSRLFKKLVEYCADKGCCFMTMMDLAQLCPSNGKQ